MKRYFFTWAALFIWACLMAQAKNTNSPNLAEPGHSLVVEPVKFPEKLKVELPEVFFKKPDTEALKDYFPALITLLVGIGTILINWYVSKKLRESQKEIMAKQLEEARKIKEMELKQSRELKLIELKNSINIKNRQQWMDEFREVVSEMVGLIVVLAVKKLERIEDNVLHEEMNKLFVLNTRIDLLLHPSRKGERETLVACKELIDAVRLDKESEPNRNKIMQDRIAKFSTCARAVLEKNWQMINNIDFEADAAPQDEV